MTNTPTRPQGISGDHPPGTALLEEITRQTNLPVAPEAAVLVDALREKFGTSLAGVLLYGSGLHGGDLTSGLVDFYVLVDSYRTAYPGRMPRLANAMLAPNVFYLEDSAHDPPLKAKYAVMSVDHFARGCSTWFHSYLWARFAQPSRLVYSRDVVAADRIRRILSTAVVRFLAETVPACEPGPMGASTLWSSGLSLAYASELRTEKNREQVLTQVNGPEFERLTALAMPILAPLLETTGDGCYRSGADRRHRRWSQRRWRMRRWQGRVLSILRLTKAAFTFDRGADYLAWKIERHTGMAITVTPALRRFPILFGPKILWRLIRGGTVR